MSLKTVIDNLFKQNTNYTEAMQAANQAASLKYLSSDLYQNSKRFIYELLQNADDSSVDNAEVHVAIRLIKGQLVVAHTGKPFDERDMQGICAIDDGTKKNSPDKTGFKGIGFKSVFGQSNLVTVYSDAEYFRFDYAYIHEWNPNWGESKAEWEAKSGRAIIYPWQLIPIYTQETEIDPEIHQFLKDQSWKVATIITLKDMVAVLAAIEELLADINMFLFLKHVGSITFDIGKEQKISLRLDQGETVVELNDEEKARWLKKVIVIVVPQEVKDKLQEDQNIPKKLAEATEVELILAGKIGEHGLEHLGSDDQLLYAYLPTEERSYKLPVLVNSAFYMIANREALHKGSAWNEWLFACLPAELLKWIGELAQQHWQMQAYNLIPSRLIVPNDNLSQAYEKGLEKALSETPFVLNTFGVLLKVDEALIDTTSLSNIPSVGGQTIRQYKITKDGATSLSTKPFVPFHPHRHKLRSLGVAAFNWDQVPGLLSEPTFAASLTVEANKELVLHLKVLYDNERITEVNSSFLSGLPYLLDNQCILRSPKEVFLPSVESTWDTIGADVAYIHTEMQTWLDEKPEIKLWLEGLGLTEKSDVSFLEKVLIPQADIFITTINAVDTIRKVYNLYESNVIGKEIVIRLNQLKLITTGGTLLASHLVFFSQDYQPLQQFQDVLQEDIYLSETYVPPSADIKKWKAFFLLLGINENVSTQKFSDRALVATLTQSGFKTDYFDSKSFQTFKNPYPGREFAGLVTLRLVDHTVDNHSFARAFWTDVVQHVPVEELISKATAYWGYDNLEKMITGDKTGNYIPWYVRTEKCLPTTDGTCLPSGEMFINSEEHVKLWGRYLPVYAGPQLSADWRSFFGFKSQLTLADYLTLLSKVTEHPAGDNKTLVQVIYSYLLDTYTNWSTAEQQQVLAWAATGHLAGSKGQYLPCAELKFFADGDDAIFGDEYPFLQVNKKNRTHANIIPLLELLQVRILRQSAFTLNAEGRATDLELGKKLKAILPFLAVLMHKERTSGSEEMLIDLNLRYDKLSIFKADKLVVTFSAGMEKKVNIHLANDNLFVIAPWESLNVIVDLPSVLTEYFEASGYLKEIDYLIRSSLPERINYLNDRGLPQPPTLLEEPAAPAPPEPQYAALPPSPKERKDYESQWAQNLARNQALIAASGNDPAKLLVDGLQAQKPGDTLYIYHFSQLENAVKIIREGALKSRAKADFKDSAGSGIIAQTYTENKQYARFYFRTKTPTQFYVENLGRGDESIKRIGDDPVCPVPIFFVIPLQEAMNSANWGVSIGTLASSQVEYGRTMDVVSRFDFDAVYKNMPDVTVNRYLMASAQEFLVKEELDLASVNYHLAVQNKEARQSLMALLGEPQKWMDRITVAPELYLNQNPNVTILRKDDRISARLSKPHPGTFILQHQANQQWNAMQSNQMQQYHYEGRITTISRERIELTANFTLQPFSLFYAYKGHIWLVETNQVSSTCDLGFVMEQISKWYASGETDGPSIINILKVHPELKYWFEQPINDQYGQTLEEHTLRVIANFQHYFGSRQVLFQHEKDYLVFLALHDVGKPAAIAAGNKHLQHEKSLDIIENLRDLLPFTTNVFDQTLTMINQDILGKYLNPYFAVSLEDTVAEFKETAASLGLSETTFWPILVTYYQCDAAAYQRLRDDIFVFEDDGLPQFTGSPARLLFKGEKEDYFQQLEEVFTVL